MRREIVCHMRFMKTDQITIHRHVAETNLNKSAGLRTTWLRITFFLELLAHSNFGPIFLGEEPLWGDNQTIDGGTDQQIGLSVI